MASPPLNFPYHFPPPQPHFQPPPPPAAKPPPPHHFPPPPPHVIPSPPPPSPSSPSGHTTVIVIVFVSCGGLFFLAFLAAALCCFMKKRKRKNIQETEVVDVDEHLKVKEAIVQGPHGPQTVVLSVEDDVHVHEAISKREEDSYFKSICFLAEKKKKKSEKETEIVKVDEHLKVKEEAVLGLRGQEAVVISVEDDVHIEGEIRKSADKFGHKQPSSSDEHKA